MDGASTEAAGAEHSTLSGTGAALVVTSAFADATFINDCARSTALGAGEARTAKTCRTCQLTTATALVTGLITADCKTHGDHCYRYDKE